LYKEQQISLFRLEMGREFVMNDLPVAAIMYDFDKTLSPRDMQEYAFIPELKMENDVFWAKCRQMILDNKMDQILAYMYVMLREAKGKKLLNRDEFHKLGKSVVLFEGVATWFHRIDQYALKQGLALEHFIISSGLKEIIEGTKIAKHFKEIYAAEFCYDESGAPVWPAMAVNFTSKTQFLFRINKGVLDVTQNEALNEYTPENKRRIPFANMIYIGDGLTDVPCMKLTKTNGGHSIAVYQGERSAMVNRMLLQRRVDFVAPADYSKDSLMEGIVFSILDKIAAGAKTAALNMEQMDEADRMVKGKQG
jgi:2-hydroxy-3-keto-5-methylthiopentenyl-1-phosphate phosphatase